MNKALLDMINDDLEKQQLLPGDIMIIDMDAFNYGKNCTHLNNIQTRLNIEVAKGDRGRYNED